MATTTFQITATNDADLGNELDAFLEGALDKIAKPRAYRKQDAKSSMLGMGDRKVIKIEIDFDGLSEALIQRLLKAISTILAGKGSVIVKR